METLQYNRLPVKRRSRRPAKCNRGFRPGDQQLLGHEQTVAQSKATLHQAAASAEKVNAQLQLAQRNYDRQVQLFENVIIARATLDAATRNLDAAKQGWFTEKSIVGRGGSENLRASDRRHRIRCARCRSDPNG